MERQALCRRRRRAANVRLDEQNLIATKAGVDRRQLPPAAEQQARADDEYERQRDLRHNQRFADAESMMPFGDAAPLRLHRRLRIDASGTPRRYEPEEQAGDRGDADREPEDTLIDAEIERDDP